jgi:hypothetical protein
MSIDLSRMRIRFDRGDSESVLSANADGLRYLAEHLLVLADSGKLGSHRHFDEGSPLDEGSGSLVVTIMAAPWDDASNTSTQADGPSGSR